MKITQPSKITSDKARQLEAMMGEASFRLERVITLGRGTFLQYQNDSGEHFYFYDANDNLQLDSADKKVTETRLDNSHFQFTSRGVYSAEIRQFGRQAGEIFQQARKERKVLLGSFAPVQSGMCYIPSLQKGYAATLANPNKLTFDPALTLKPQSTNNQNYYLATDMVNNASINPFRCLMIRSEVVRKKVAGLPIFQEKIEVGTGDLLSMTLPVLAALDLKNGPLLDVAYQIVAGAKRVHLDLTPPSP